MDSTIKNDAAKQSNSLIEDMRVITSLNDFLKKSLKKISLGSLLIILNDLNNFQLFHFIFSEILAQ